jgi:hypothetical protein
VVDGGKEGRAVLHDTLPVRSMTADVAATGIRPGNNLWAKDTCPPVSLTYAGLARRLVSSTGRQSCRGAVHAAIYFWLRSG